MIRKLAFHEISQKLPFQGNSLKLQLADYQPTAIFFFHLCTTLQQSPPGALFLSVAYIYDEVITQLFLYIPWEQDR